MRLSKRGVRPQRPRDEAQTAPYDRIPSHAQPSPHPTSTKRSRSRGSSTIARPAPKPAGAGDLRGRPEVRRQVESQRRVSDALSTGGPAVPIGSSAPSRRRCSERYGRDRAGPAAAGADVRLAVAARGRGHRARRDLRRDRDRGRRDRRRWQRAEHPRGRRARVRTRRSGPRRPLTAPRCSTSPTGA